MWVFSKSSSACLVLFFLCCRIILTQDIVFLGLAQPPQPTHAHKSQIVCTTDLYYYHSDTTTTRKLFIPVQRTCAVTLPLLTVPGLWDSLSLKGVHYSSLRVCKKDFFSQRPGVTPPHHCLQQPPPPSHPGQTTSLLTPVTKILEPPVLSSHPLVAWIIMGY